MNRGPKHLGKPGTFDGLCRQFAAMYRLSIRDAKAMARAVLQLATTQAKTGGRQETPFGTFYAAKCLGRRVVAPDGTEHSAPAAEYVRFRPAKKVRR